MKDDKQINLQTPYEIKSPTCTRKHLNINITDTGKGNNRRWQAPGGQRVQRANSAGRFRHGCPRSYTPLPPFGGGYAETNTIPAGDVGIAPYILKRVFCKTENIGKRFHQKPSTWAAFVVAKFFSKSEIF